MPCVLVLAGPSGAGAQGPPDIAVEGAWARETIPPRTTTAVYLTIRNRGDRPLVLRSASSPDAASVELHEMRVVGQIMRMRRVDSIDVPAGERVVLDPGGLHLMLSGATRQLRAGDELSLVLTFDRATVRVTVPVRRTPPGWTNEP